VDELFAVCTPGLEGVLAAEIAQLGLGGGVASPGGVTVSGHETALFRLHLGLRTATRVLVRVGAVQARDFAKLRARAGALWWERFATAGQGIDVHVTTRRCRLYHTGAIAERVSGAIADRLGPSARAADAATTVLPLPVHVRGEDDTFWFSVDASGEPLYRRGYRVDTAAASLRETLAAGLLALAGVRPSEAVVDPMCGAGTIAIEAALARAGTLPGASRGFGFQGWPGHDARAFATAKRELAAAYAGAQAAAAGAAPLAPITAGDRDAQTLALARRNAERAGVLDRIRFFEGDASDVPLPDGAPGLILANPPYGKRLSAGSGGAAFGSLARLSRRAPSWRVALLVPTPALPAVAKSLGRGAPASVTRLQNGGLSVSLAIWPPR
jgi:putative N6-adenine-specific DNA methylase